MSVLPQAKPTAAMNTGGVRWIVCALLFAAVALSYIDRQVLSVLESRRWQADYHWTETGLRQRRLLVPGRLRHRLYRVRPHRRRRSARGLGLRARARSRYGPSAIWPMHW